MGSLCWKAISMDKRTLGVFILISFGQESFLSATTSHEKVESLVDHLDKKFSQIMKDQQEEIKQLQEKIKLLESDSMNCSQETLSKIGEQKNHVPSLTEFVDSLNNNISVHEKSINFLSDPPFLFYCGYRGVTRESNSILTFDRHSYAYTNQ